MKQERRRRIKEIRRKAKMKQERRRKEGEIGCRHERGLVRDKRATRKRKRRRKEK